MKIKRCTMCGKKFEQHDMFADLCFEKQIGYGSIHDGETFKINLCCECFDSAAYILRKICKFNVFKN